MRNILAGFATVVMSSVAFMCSAEADIIQDPLHGFCWGATPTCTDNGSITPEQSATPNFGFTISPGPQTGDFHVDVLVPNNDAGGPSYSITGTGGPLGTSNVNASATLFSGTAWTSGDLDTYMASLFSGASPSNPLDAFLPLTQSIDGGATGYFVYDADLGSTHLLDASTPGVMPLLNLASPALFPGSVIVGFFDSSKSGWVATAPSGALLFNGTTTNVPEPGSLLIMGSALIGLGVIRRRHHRRRDAAAI